MMNINLKNTMSTYIGVVKNTFVEKNILMCLTVDVL